MVNNVTTRIFKIDAVCLVNAHNNYGYQGHSCISVSMARLSFLDEQSTFECYLFWLHMIHLCR